jgi:hypothetical protein
MAETKPKRAVREPRHDRDPYMRDRNISSAAGLQIVGGVGLGAGMGWAVVGWFNLGISIGLGIGIGAVLGFVIANVLLYQYGGRSTR